MRYHIEYVVLGVMITGGMAMTVGGSRMLQEYMYASVIGAQTGIPPGLSLVLFGCVIFGVAGGYLMRDIQSGGWDTEELE